MNPQTTNFLRGFSKGGSIACLPCGFMILLIGIMEGSWFLIVISMVAMIISVAMLFALDRMDAR